MPAPTSTSMTSKRIARIMVSSLLVMAIGFAFMHRDAIALDSLLARFEALGPWGPIAFMLSYIVVAVLFLPGSPLTLAGGALFGPVLGTVYSLIGATFGATLAFLIARLLAGDLVRRRAGKRLQPLLDGVDREGWRFVAFTRLVPIFPFNLLNYGFGLTRIGLVPYMLTSVICMIPGAAAFSWIGYAGRNAVDGDSGAIRAGMIGLGLLATVMFLVPKAVARWRKR